MGFYWSGSMEMYHYWPTYSAGSHRETGCLPLKLLKLLKECV